MSYLENALTSNPVLAKLAARSQKDVYAVIKLAQKAHQAHGSHPVGTGRHWYPRDVARGL